MSVAFDTLKAFQRFKDAGFTVKQAEALVRTFVEVYTAQQR